MKQQSIACVTLVVPDYDDAIAHYTGDLGFDLIEDTDLPRGQRWVLVAPPGTRGTHLLLAKAKDEAQARCVGNQTGGRVFLFLHTDDFARDHAAFQAKGIVFLEAPRVESYGTVAVFQDKFGNHWDLLQPSSKAPTPVSGAHTAAWRAAAIACLLFIAIATAAAMSMFEQFKAQVAYLQSQLHSTPQVQYVAVLLDPHQAPAMLVTYSPQEGALQVQRLNDVKEGRDDSLYLWALGDGGKPRLLGVLESKAKTLQIRTERQALQGVTQLAISVESKSAVVPASTPALPYLFTGAWVQKAL